MGIFVCAAFFLLSPATKAHSNPWHTAGIMAGLTTDTVCLTDAQLDQIRGGLGGFHFGLSFGGFFDRLGNVSGKIFSANENLPSELIEPVVATMASDVDTSTTVPANLESVSVPGANISAYVGNFDGASGIFQISQSPGSYNVITNTMTINISIFNFSSESQASAMLPRFLNAQ